MDNLANLPGSNWICQTCKEPITGDEGFVEVINLDSQQVQAGGYPREAGKIGFVIYHKDNCDPHPDADGYAFSTGRATTLEEWNAWVLHLFEKNWMGREDMERMLQFWWTHKGEILPSPPG